MTKKGTQLKARPLAKKVLDKVQSKVFKKSKLKKAAQKQVELKTLTPKTLLNSKDIIKTAIQQAGIDDAELASEFKKLGKLIKTRNDAEKAEVAKNITALLNQHTHILEIFKVIRILNKTRSVTKTKIELLQSTKDKFDHVVQDLTNQEYQLSNGQPVKTQNDALLYLIEHFKSHQTAT
ncbi:hypothetical protein [Rheinheimera sp. F8]|uniref:hypothetical protein n=1 Tax=Rheinheimera sp. F8 TaxID=1763998 RepID=UPI000744C311|nr:hypothetical protein [Rheinheimera sp. F8]ALZ77333.1 hypothetical protein ATY27_17260 [Rheinheimera sp. F8]